MVRNFPSKVLNFIKWIKISFKIYNFSLQRMKKLEKAVFLSSSRRLDAPSTNAGSGRVVEEEEGGKNFFEIWTFKQNGSQLTFRCLMVTSGLGYIAGALMLHCWCIAIALQVHWRCIEGVLQVHCRCIAGALHLHCICIVSALQVHCRCITDALQVHCGCIRS